METFFAEYSKQLLWFVAERPEEYGYTVASVPDVLAKMRPAIQAGLFVKKSSSFKATCKALGIKHTYKAIAHFIANHK